MTRCERSGQLFSSAPAVRTFGHSRLPCEPKSVRLFSRLSSAIIRATPSPSKGLSGVLEIRDNFDGNTYRAVYTVRFEDVLYVLHVFHKKSTKGIATPKRHLDLVRQRLRDAETIHRATEETRL